MQEAFARAWEHRSSLDADAGGWVRTTALRVAVSRWRKARNAVRGVGQGRQPHRAPAARRPGRRPGVADQELWEALRALPAAQREALALHHLLDLGVDQVAALVGAPDRARSRRGCREAGRRSRPGSAEASTTAATSPTRQRTRATSGPPDRPPEAHDDRARQGTMASRPDEAGRGLVRRPGPARPAAPRRRLGRACPALRGSPLGPPPRGPSPRDPAAGVAAAVAAVAVAVPVGLALSGPGPADQGLQVATQEPTPEPTAPVQERPTAPSGRPPRHRERGEPGGALGGRRDLPTRPPRGHAAPQPGRARSDGVAGSTDRPPRTPPRSPRPPWSSMAALEGGSQSELGVRRVRLAERQHLLRGRLAGDRRLRGGVLA